MNVLHIFLSEGGSVLEVRKQKTGCIITKIIITIIVKVAEMRYSGGSRF